MIDKEHIAVDDESVLKALLTLQKRCERADACETCFAWDVIVHDCLISCYPNGRDYIRAIKSLELDIAKEKAEHE